MTKSLNKHKLIQHSENQYNLSSFIFGESNALVQVKPKFDDFKLQQIQRLCTIFTITGAKSSSSTSKFKAAAWPSGYCVGMLLLCRNEVTLSEQSSEDRQLYGFKASQGQAIVSLSKKLYKKCSILVGSRIRFKNVSINIPLLTQSN